jgi:hypothetical protein
MIPSHLLICLLLTLTPPSEFKVLKHCKCKGVPMFHSIRADGGRPKVQAASRACLRVPARCVLTVGAMQASIAELPAPPAARVSAPAAAPAASAASPPAAAPAPAPAQADAAQADATVPVATMVAHGEQAEGLPAAVEALITLPAGVRPRPVSSCRVARAQV